MGRKKTRGANAAGVRAAAIPVAALSPHKRSQVSKRLRKKGTTARQLRKKERALSRLLEKATRTEGHLPKANDTRGYESPELGSESEEEFAAETHSDTRRHQAHIHTTVEGVDDLPPGLSLAHLKRNPEYAVVKAHSMWTMIEPSTKSANYPPAIAKLQEKDAKTERGQLHSWYRRLNGALANRADDEADEYSPLHHAICRFIEEIESRPDDQREEQAIRLIERLAKLKWSQCGVSIFGSRACGIATKESDLDICITGLAETSLAGGGFSKQEKREVIKLLRVMQKSLIQAKRSGVRAVESVTVIAHARVPILKCKLYGLPVDVSFGATNGVAAVPFIRGLVSQFVALRPLLLLLKRFLAVRGYDEVYTGGLGSYSLINIIVCHLQLSQCSAYKIRGQSGMYDLGVLFVTFLERFSFKANPIRFPFYSQALSSMRGGMYPRDLLDADDSDNLLAVEDPQDLGRDICRGSYNMKGIVDAFGKAAHSIRAAYSVRRTSTTAVDPDELLRREIEGSF